MFNSSPRALIDANVAIPSHLHPVALRSSANASTPHTAAAAHLAEAQLRVSHHPTGSDGHQSSTHSHSNHSSNASSDSSYTSSPTSPLSNSNSINPTLAGLPIDPSAYPLLSTLDPSAPHASSIHLLSCADYASLYHAYLRSAATVDESTVFPYLHCPDRPGTAQANYFSQAHHQHSTHPPQPHPARSAPAYRGLTVLTADPALGPRTPRHRTRSLGSASTASASSLSSSAPLSSTSSPATSVDGPEPRASLLVSALSPDEVLDRNPATGALLPRFARRPLPTNTVNLRLFGHQPGQYACVSDVVIYSEAGLTDTVLELAGLVVEAQAEFKDRISKLSTRPAEHRIDYHVLVIHERFEGFEKDFGALVAVDGWGFRRSKVDFFERERLEMEALTRATEIDENVWLGNTADAVRDEEERPTAARYSVMIEAHDAARIANVSELETVSSTLLAPPSSPASSASSSSSPMGRRGRPTVHLEVPSTGPAAAATSVDQLVRLMQDFCSWVSRTAASGHRVLIHCHDGYTETTLFGLAYLIYSRRCPLSAAFLFLQHDAGRSFFLYPSDLAVLRYFERRCSYSDPTLSPIPRGERWLEDGFEGHFPSRILPFLYLGNLSHANNVGMLRALGITAVVSMGESAKAALTGRGLALLDVRAMADDGLDPISAHLPAAMEFIDRHRRAGGKVLVHCRVGVSRSATVVIGYVMLHCGIDLAAAYLLVRSRRLNILIQPNLVFMWALRKWEAQLQYFETSKEIQDIRQGGAGEGCGCGICGEERGTVKRRVGAGGWTWSALALEISLLNQRYLC